MPADNGKNILPCGCDATKHPPSTLDHQGFFYFLFPPEALEHFRRNNQAPPGIRLVQCNSCKRVISFSPLLPQRPESGLIVVPGGSV